MENILETQSISKTYGSIQAVNNLSLKIPRGTIFGLLGPNGSGKTTTLGMILGVIRPSGGDYSWFGKKLTFEAKQRIGAILETPNFYPYLSARKNLELVAKIKEVENPQYDKILELVGLKARAGSKFKTYSLGMKQRLAIASALLNNPEVLVLDEPTNGLDPQGIAEIRSLILEIAQRGITVLLASHLLDEVEKVCTNVAVLRHGELLFSGKVEELIAGKGLIEISSAENEKLNTVLAEHPAVKSIKAEKGRLMVVLNEDTDPAELNKYLSQRGIFANHIVMRNNTLEEQFLDLVRQ